MKEMLYCVSESQSGTMGARLMQVAKDLIRIFDVMGDAHFQERWAHVDELSPVT